MADAPATPPKFVPTLTDEVMLPDADTEADTGVEGQDLEEVESTGQGAALTQGYELPSAVGDDDELPLDASSDELPPESVPLLDEEAVVPYLSPPLDNASEEDGIEPSDSAAAPTQKVVPDSVLPDGYEEYVIHRVMQRVDVMLEKRLREAIATVIQEQTRSIVPRLREEVESVVRQSVYEAVADELAGSSQS